jgi:hypothetical protein
MGGTFSKHGRHQKYVQNFLWETPKGRAHFEDTGGGEMIILRRILGK